MASARLAQFKRLRLLDWRYGAIFIVGVVSLVFTTFQQHPKIVGFIPVGNPLKSNFRTKWVGVITTSTQAKQAKAARELTRFQPKTSSFPVYVVSLTDAHARRESVTAELELRNITFSWVDAVNGAGEMPEDLVKWYSSQSRFRRYKQADVGSRAYRKMACDLSHLLLMHRMIAQMDDMQLVFEDDVKLLDENNDFLQRLNTTLADLPEDWELLFLQHGNPIQRKPSNLGGWVGDRVRLFTDNSGTNAFMYTRVFALKVLNDAQIGNKYIDNLINDMVQLRRAVGYVVDPPLAHIYKFQSQIDI